MITAMKQKNTNRMVLHAAGFLFSLLLALLVLRPLQAGAADHYLTPYQDENLVEYYTGETGKSFKMMGKEFAYGVMPGGNYSSERSVMYNLEKQFTSVEVTVGHIDGKTGSPAKLYVYLDEKLASSYTLDLTDTMMNKTFTINTAGVTQLRFDTIRTSGSASVWFGLGDVIGAGGHLYTKKEMTKAPTLSAAGQYTYTCSACGATKTETIPAKTYCTPYLQPYQTDNFNLYNDTGDENSYFTVMGKRCYEGICRKHYDYSQEALFNLNQEYTSLSFMVGHEDGRGIDGHGGAPATLYIYADGSTTAMKTQELDPKMVSRKITIDVTGITQLRLYINRNSGSNSVYYCIYDMTYTRKSNLAHKFASEVVTEATDDTAGIRKHVCEKCGLTYMETIPAKNAESETKPAESETNPEESETKPADSAPKKGQKVKNASATYTVLSSKTVTYTAPVNKKTKTVKIPATVKLKGKTFKVTKIAASAFRSNKYVTTLVIGNNVTTIGAQAFSGCTRLSKVTIGSGVSTIGKQAFYKCKKLKKIIVKSKKLKKAKIGAKTFTGIPASAKVDVPNAKKSAYRKAFRARGLNKKVKVY